MSGNEAVGLTLVAVFCVTLAWPINAPLMALAYKFRIGHQPIPMGLGTFWLSSLFASFALAFLGLLPLLLLWFVPVLGVLLLIGYFFFYVPIASYLIHWIYGFEEIAEGLSVFLLYLLVPATPLFFLLWLTGQWRWFLHLFRLLED